MKKILIVEDVELNTELLIQLLEDDYALLTAVDGQEGMAMAEQHKPDLILMDMSLPVMGTVMKRPAAHQSQSRFVPDHHHRPLCPRHER